MSFRSNRHIRSSDVKKMLAFLHDLHEVKAVDEFGPHMIALLDEMLPGTNAVFEEAGADGLPLRYAHNFKIDLQTEMKFYGVLQAFGHQKPIIQYLQHGGMETALRNSDMISLRNLQKTDIYHHFFLPLECWHQLYAVIPTADVTLKFSFQRDRDFSEEMREIFRLLSSHVALAYRNAQRFSELRQKKPNEPTHPDTARLTERESEILHWIQQGKRNGEIAMILHISERTVEKHVENILRKLKVETRTSAALIDSAGTMRQHG